MTDPTAALRARLEQEAVRCVYAGIDDEDSPRLAALLREAAQALASHVERWAPIESAPKDGTAFLLVYLAGSGPRVTQGKWSLKRQQWWCDVGDVPAYAWQPMPIPLPPPPTPRQE